MKKLCYCVIIFFVFSFLFVVVEVETMLKKRPSHVLKLADKESLSAASQSRRLSADQLDFVDVVKMSEDWQSTSPARSQPDVLI